MDFNYGTQDEAFRTEFRAWLDLNREYAVPPRPPLSPEAPGELEKRIRWHRRLHEGGWLAVSWPKEYGGRGASILQNIIYYEELERAGSTVPFVGSGVLLLGPTLIQWGTDEQKRYYIPRLLRAEDIWAQGYSEPNAGSDLAGLQTRAVEDGDDFVVNGSKIWTSGAHYSNWIFLLVRNLLVDLKAPGVTIAPLVQMNGARGFNQVFFEDVCVPRKNLVGEKNNGWQVAMTTLMYERSGSNDRGLIKQVRDLAELARHVTVGEHKAWELNSVRQRIAGFAIEAQSIRYTGYRQLTRQLKGLPPGPEGSMMKLCSSELALRIANYAMELLGPYSQFEFGADYALENGKWSNRMLSARGATIYSGTNQIQHNIIGERVLQLPKG
jgi:alkylation response protein AidB-like acyl-CoA dehydrogenase